jgi:hypothetical protein
MAELQRPTFDIAEQEKYSATEVGITHQFTNAFVRLTDSGDIELVAGEGLAIILHAANKSITLVGDKVRFITKETGGLVWNGKYFNERATKFTEPAFYTFSPEDGVGMFRGYNDFLEEEA